MNLSELIDGWPPPPRRRVFLMRHGDVEYFDGTGKPFRPDSVPLTELGQHQARTAAALLADVPLDRVVTSGLRRTEETARLIVEQRDVTLHTEPRFREIETGRMSEWAAVSPARIRQAILQAFDHSLTADTPFLAGETFGSCQSRIREAWRELIAQPDWTHLLIVAHGVVNRLLLADCLGMPIAAIGRIEQDAGCVNLIELDDARNPLVRLINHTSHDPGKHRLRLTSFEGFYDQFLRGIRPRE